MKNLIYSILVFALFSLAACEGKYPAKDIAEEESFLNDTTYVKLVSKSIANDSLAYTYKAIVAKYMEMSEALIEAQPMEVSKSAMEMMLLLKKANVKSLNATQINFWDEQMDAMALFLKKIAESKDIKVQRNEFYPLSQNLYDLYVQIGLQNVPVYKQYCPMAFKNKGAFWLSNSEEVLNPYFGSEMLHCGEIKEKIFNP